MADEKDNKEVEKKVDWGAIWKFYQRKSLIDGVENAAQAKETLRKNPFAGSYYTTLMKSFANGIPKMLLLTGIALGVSMLFPPVGAAVGYVAWGSLGLFGGVVPAIQAFGPKSTRSDRKKLHKLANPKYRSLGDRIKSRFQQNKKDHVKLATLQAEQKKCTDSLEELKQLVRENEKELTSDDIRRIAETAKKFMAKLAEIEPEIKTLERKIQEGNKMGIFSRKNKKQVEPETPVAGSQELDQEMADLKDLLGMGGDTSEAPNREEHRNPPPPPRREDQPILGDLLPHEEVGQDAQAIADEVRTSKLEIRKGRPIRVGEDAAKIIEALQANNELYHTKGCIGDARDILKLTRDDIDDLVDSDLEAKLDGFTAITIDSKDFDIKGTLAGLELCAEQGDLAAAKAHFAIKSYLHQQLQIQEFQHRVKGDSISVDAYALGSIDKRNVAVSEINEITPDNFNVDAGPIEGNEHDIYVNQFDKYLGMLRREVKQLEAGVFPGTDTPIKQDAAEILIDQTQGIIDEIERARALQVQAAKHFECASHCQERLHGENRENERVRKELTKDYYELNDRLYDLKNSEKLQEVTDTAIKAIEAKFEGTWDRTVFKQIADQAKAARTSTRETLSSHMVDFGKERIRPAAAPVPPAPGGGRGGK